MLNQPRQLVGGVPDRLQLSMVPGEVGFEIVKVDLQNTHRRAQLMGGVGDEMFFPFKRLAQAHQQFIHCLDDRHEFRGQRAFLMQW